ncbi:MAG: hypothetical protein DI562_13775 [Stenotrophomonas acidaminiphila]|nr:MAG: hypothetical protein DI562_13775 [Stenotrophomonas acidaminiphila]
MTPFAVLPGDVRHPESLAVDPASGEVYVGQGLLWVAANQIDTRSTSAAACATARGSSSA